MTSHLRFGLFCGLALVLVPYLAQNRTQTAKAADNGPQIAAVSIHQLPDNEDNTGYGGSFDGAYFRAHAYSAEMLLRFAFGIGDPSRVQNLPQWASSKKYDIAATVETQDGSSPRGKSSSSRTAQLIELSILESRFNLRFHYVSAKRPAFSLVQVKSGFKQMKQVPAPSAERPDEPCVWAGRSPGFLKADSCTMDDLASALNLVDDRQVLNETNLNGHFAFEVHFNYAATSSVVNGTRFSANPGHASEWPSIYSALPSQLGLKLKATTADVPSVVIDQITGPTDN